MLIYLIIVIAVIFMLQSIVIANILQCLLIIRCAYMRLWQGAQPPLEASGIILPEGPARETLFPALLPAVTYANLAFSVRTSIGVHV